ncbi:hypothetical protein C0959_00265 [Campylobacter coli]|nr:hypothetical protein [Campylobacter coli]
MKRYTTVYEECLKLFIKLQNSNDEEKLKIYSEMMSIIKSNFDTLNTVSSMEKIEKMLDTYYETELDDPKGNSTISLYNLVYHIRNIQHISNKEIKQGCINSIIELYTTILFLKKKLEKGIV